jgi:putative ABC transport system permease protein
LAKVHAGSNAELTTTRMMAALHEFDPGLMIIQAKTMQQHLATMVLPAQLGAVAFALFAGLALVLAMIGIYGVVRYAVARRSREVAIRLAVGASPSGVVRLLMREGLTLVGAGAVIGIVLGLLASRALQSLLYGVAAIDPVAFIAAGGTLVGVGALAAFLPARRASRVDPASTLRAE